MKSHPADHDRFHISGAIPVPLRRPVSNSTVRDFSRPGISVILTRQAVFSDGFTQAHDRCVRLQGLASGGRTDTLFSLAHPACGVISGPMAWRHGHGDCRAQHGHRIRTKALENIARAQNHVAARKVPRIVEFARSVPKPVTGTIGWRLLQDHENRKAEKAQT